MAMSLTTEDISQIRTVIREEVREIVHDEVQTEIQKEVRPLARKIDELAGNVEALENDIKEIYQMLKDMQGAVITSDKTFAKLDLEEKVLKLNAELLVAANQAGIKLPR